MTRDDCYKSLLNTKVFVKDRSASIQCILFSLGFEWNGGRSCSSLVRRTDAPFLFISEDGKITCSNSTDHFYSMNNKEVSAEYILSMKYIDEELSVPYLSPWISVNERLPHEENDGLSIKVLVVSTKGKIHLSRYDYHMKGWISPILDIVFTHWMPIPEPPKE